MKKNNLKNRPPVIPSKKKLTLAQRSADIMTMAMGSWTFLFVFSILMIAWVAVNVFAWQYRWDPYPFILLNLALSCLSAMQAPIILMSQNRQAERDRAMTKHDYIVDRQAEREVREIQEKLEEIKKLIQNKK